MTTNTPSRTDRPADTSAAPLPGPYSTGPYSTGPSDEISLVDIAKVLWKRRWWTVGIAVLTTVAALLFALSKEHEYSYTTTIRIGETNIDRFVSTGDGVREVMERRFLPQLRQSFTVDHGLHRVPFDLKVEADRESRHVTLNSRSTLENEALLRSFHSELAALIASDHNERIQLVSRQNEIRLQNLRTRLAAQQRRLDNWTALAVDVAAIEVEAAESMADGVDLNLGLGAQSAETTGRPVFRPTLSSGDPSLTVLLNRVHLTELITQYEGAIADLIREIEDIELRREWITPTQVVVEAIRSESPVGTGRSLILALGLVLGGMLGLFGAFLAEFIAQVRASLRGANDIAAGGKI